METNRPQPFRAQALPQRPVIRRIDWEGVTSSRMESGNDRSHGTGQRGRNRPAAHAQRSASQGVQVESHGRQVCFDYIPGHRVNNEDLAPPMRTTLFEDHEVDFSDSDGQRSGKRGSSSRQTVMTREHGEGHELRIVIHWAGNRRKDGGACIHG